LGRGMKRFFAVVLVLAAWAIWWARQPQPDVRLSLDVTASIDSWQVAGDGRSLICESTSRGCVEGRHETEIFELPSGVRTCTFGIDVVSGVHLSPDGERFACCGTSRNLHLRKLPNGEEMCALPRNDDVDGDVSNAQWTPDGRYLLAFDTG